MSFYLFLFFVYIFALHFAANYADAEDASYQKCTILSVVLIFVHIVVHIIFSSNSLLSMLVAVILGTLICLKVLKIPGSNFLMFMVMFAFFQMIISGGASLVINGIARA